MANQREEALVENLQDAGCAPEVIERFMTCCACDEAPGQLRILMQQRSVLLDCIHAYQKKLDCLDYLIHKLKKTKAEKPSHAESEQAMAE